MFTVDVLYPQMAWVKLMEFSNKKKREETCETLQ